MPPVQATARFVLLLLLGLPLRTSAAESPSWQRLLRGDDARKAALLEKEQAELEAEGKFEDALKTADALVELRAKLQGADHWETENARWTAQTVRHLLRQEKAAREEYLRSFALLHRATVLKNAIRFREAQPLLQQ